MELLTLENLPKETEKETKKCNILYLERTRMEVFALEQLFGETEIETKMQNSLPAEDKDGGIYCT